jgi:hypothetical protein
MHYKMTFFRHSDGTGLHCRDFQLFAHISAKVGMHLTPEVLGEKKV